MKLARPLVIAAIAGLALVAAALAWQTLGNSEPVPTVSYTLLDGRKSTTEALRGKVVLVNFWATSCTVCVAEMPQIISTHNKFRERSYDTVAVAMSYDPPALVARFAESRRLPFGVAIDNTGEIAKRFGDVELTPTTFLIDKRGRIVKRYVGAPDFAELHVLVEELLAQT
ncbi:MAG: TlpA disulfide reductase family protein [Burkholderiaceae bacterium]|nr:TlpA disulfide reductase family protein [Burkholderiaceae bacterium]